MNRSATHIEQRQVVRMNEGEPLGFAGVMGLLKVNHRDTQGRFVAAIFPEIPPRVLAAPLHRRHNEDEFTCVLEGALGVQRGDHVITAEAGAWVLKPRGQWHTFWNAADVPCRTVEIVSPGGFEQYFRDLISLSLRSTSISVACVPSASGNDLKSKSSLLPPCPRRASN